jgi:hypothetical protein
MVASSQIMRDAIRSNLAVPLCFVKLQMAPLSIVRGILKHEWAVLPLGIIEAAIPDVAIAIAILF